MFHYAVLLLVVTVSQATRFASPLKQNHAFTDMLLRDIIDRMGNELADAADSFMDYQDGPRGSVEYDNVKEVPVPLDYDTLENYNRNPSIRDQEYLRHSSLLSYQRLNNKNMNHKIQQGGIKGVKNEKTDNNLPAYCTPPNPCPIGYTSENHCLVEFENTAAFSRDYQNAQDCMCDIEHMIDCSSRPERDDSSNVPITNTDFLHIVNRFQESNPFLHGEKLPIAAKKGINVIY